MARKRVGIIGGGVSGLAAIKSCLEQGLEPVAFELLDNTGGSWYFTQDQLPYQGASLFESICANSSKELTCFSDFPVPDDWPHFLPHHLFEQYLQNYAKRFDLTRYIRLRHMVTAVEPAEDYSHTGKWKIKVKDLETSSEEEMVFDFMMICTGYQRLPKWPHIPGLDMFKGEVMHALTYRRWDVFRDKKVLIVGNGFSAGDIACDAGHVSKEVYVSVGKGVWLAERTGPDNIPIEFALSTRIPHTHIYSHTYAAKRLLRNLMAFMDQRRYGMGSAEYPFQGTGTFFSSEMKYMLTTARVKVKANLLSLSERGAKFSDGTELQDIDFILFATGYKPDTDYIKCPDLKGSPLESEMYRWTFPINDLHPTLAFIGLAKSVGATLPMFEMQGRWAAMLFNNKVKLPSKEVMLKDLESRRVYAKDHCAGKDNMVPWELDDEIAEEIGILPSWWRLLLRSPMAGCRYLFGPALPVWYRVSGDGALPDGLERANRSYWRAYNTPNFFRPDGKMANLDWDFLRVFIAVAVVGIVIVAFVMK